MNKAFTNFTWKDSPDTSTPLNANNLQKLNDAIDTIDDRVIAIIPAYPIESGVTKWNIEMRAGQISPSFTLPTPPSDSSAEIRYIFKASTTSASFTAPSGYILGNEEGYSGLTIGNTLSYTDLTVGSIYECSFAVIDSTHISLIIKEWATA